MLPCSLSVFSNNKRPESEEDLDEIIDERAYKKLKFDLQEIKQENAELKKFVVILDGKLN